MLVTPASRQERRIRDVRKVWDKTCKSWALQSMQNVSCLTIKIFRLADVFYGGTGVFIECTSSLLVILYTDAENFQWHKWRGVP